MPAYRAALDALAQLTVAGVRHNYALSALPETLTRAQLPALLVLPGDHPAGAIPLFGDRGGAFQTVAFSGAGKSARCTATHLLLVAPSMPGGLRQRLPLLIDLVDAYLLALAADPLLGGALAEPARVSIEPGSYPHPYASRDPSHIRPPRFHGCAFRHTWKLIL